MREHRGIIGGALLSAAALAWITPLGLVAAKQTHASNGFAIALFIAGGACVIAAVWVFRLSAPASSVARPPTHVVHYRRQPTLAEVVGAAEPARKRTELSALIQRGIELRQGMDTGLVRHEDRMAESIRLKINVEEPLATWLNESWEWVDREAPEHIGLVTPVNDWPKRAALESWPGLVDTRVAELRAVLAKL